jgi:hypothetical protein
LSFPNSQRTRRSKGMLKSMISIIACQGMYRQRFLL